MCLFLLLANAKAYSACEDDYNMLYLTMENIEFELSYTWEETVGGSALSVDQIKNGYYETTGQVIAYDKNNGKRGKMIIEYTLKEEIDHHGRRCGTIVALEEQTNILSKEDWELVFFDNIVRN